jgi:hypothetical protein
MTLRKGDGANGGNAFSPFPVLRKRPLSFGRPSYGPAVSRKCRNSRAESALGRVGFLAPRAAADYPARLTRVRVERGARRCEWCSASSRKTRSSGRGRKSGTIFSLPRRFSVYLTFPLIDLLPFAPGRRQPSRSSSIAVRPRYGRDSPRSCDQGPRTRTGPSRTIAVLPRSSAALTASSSSRCEIFCARWGVRSAGESIARQTSLSCAWQGVRVAASPDRRRPKRALRSRHS